MITELLGAITGVAGSATNPTTSGATQRSNTDNYVSTGAKIFGVNPNADLVFGNDGQLVSVGDASGMASNYRWMIIIGGAVVLAYILKGKK